MKHLKVGNMAFWRYTWPKPYLGGKITKIEMPERPNGEIYVWIDGYSKMRFVPSFCLPLKQGKEFETSLNKAVLVYKEQVRHADAFLEFKLKTLLPKGFIHI